MSHPLITDLYEISEGSQESTLAFDDGTEIEIDAATAQDVLDLYSSLDTEEQKRFLDLATASADEFWNTVAEYQDRLAGDLNAGYDEYVDEEFDT